MSVAPHTRAIEIGSAGEHIVCADLLLLGHRAFLAAQGLPYDVVCDAGGRLVRVTVKSAGKAVPRPEREGSRVCYTFAVQRRARYTNSIKSVVRRYEPEDVDIVALVALDIRAVAYLPIRHCPTSVQIRDHSKPTTPRIFGPKNAPTKYRFETLTFDAALAGGACVRT